MSVIDELRQIFREILSAKQSVSPLDRGLLGDGQGNLWITTDSDPRVWFRKNGQASQLVKVYCWKCRPVYGIPVVCGYTAEQPALYQVLDWDRDKLESVWDGMASVARHASMHIWSDELGGDDPVMVWTRALMAFRVSPQEIPDTTVQVEGPEMFLYGTSWVRWAGQAVYNLIARYPPAGFHCFCLVSIDGATNVLQATAGANVAIGLPIPSASYPAPPAASIPLALVHLETSAGGVSQPVEEDDILDARVIVSSGGGCLTPAAHHLVDSTVHDDSEVYGVPAQGDVLRFDADWEKLALSGAHEIFKVNAAGTLPIWAPFVWAEIAAAAGAAVAHDHSIAALGGIDLNPERISTRLVICGPGLPNATLGAAVTRVNALGPPALNSEWVILGLGRTAEAGPVTIPSYCYVFGMEEGFIVGMGANQLILSANSGLYNAKVTGNPGVWAGLVYANNAANVKLRNVHSVESSVVGGQAFYFIGTSAVEANHCVGEVTGAGSGGFASVCTSFTAQDCRAIALGTIDIGFNIGGTGVAVLDNCVADDATNFQTALNVNASACTVTTRHCTFKAAAAGDDVNTGAGSTWQDMASNYDAGNITVGGTFTPLPQSPVNLDGRVDGLILDADGDTTISSPVDDQIDLEVGGSDILHLVPTALKSEASIFPNLGTTTLAEKIGHIYLGTSRDVYPFDDGGGLFQRNPNSWNTPTTHFNEWSGWVWATYAGFVTPANIDIATYPSVVTIWNSSANGVARAFAYRAAFAPLIRARCSIAEVQQRTGLRMDDASNNNYAELWLDPDGTGLVRLWYRYAVGGAVTGPTQLWAAHGQPHQFYILQLARVGDTVYMYNTVDTPRFCYLGSIAIAGWTPTRSGIYHELTAASYDISWASLFDWFIG